MLEVLHDFNRKLQTIRHKASVQINTNVSRTVLKYFEHFLLILNNSDFRIEFGTVNFK